MAHAECCCCHPARRPPARLGRSHRGAELPRRPSASPIGTGRMLASLDVVAVEGRAGDQELAELLGVRPTAPTRLHTTSGPPSASARTLRSRIDRSSRSPSAALHDAFQDHPRRLSGSAVFGTSCRHVPVRGSRWSHVGPQGRHQPCGRRHPPRFLCRRCQEERSCPNAADGGADTTSPHPTSSVFLRRR